MGGFFFEPAGKCLPQTPYVLTASLSAVGTVLDITTDLMSTESCLSYPLAPLSSLPILIPPVVADFGSS